MKSERGPLTEAALQLSEQMSLIADELKKFMPVPFMTEKRRLPPDQRGVNNGKNGQYGY